MSRKAIKTISNQEIKYIADDMKDLDENAPNMADRPIIVYGKKLTNTQKWQMKEYLGELNDKNTMVEGTGDALEFVWKNAITRVCNIIEKIDGKDVEVGEVTGEAKDRLWNSEGMETSIYGAIAKVQESSELSDKEVKI